MWSLLGDESTGQPGTYFYNDPNPDGTYWNMFDQVLLRPELCTSFEFDRLRIVDSVGAQSLLKQRRPDKGKSDHLPIAITLDV